VGVVAARMIFVYLSAGLLLGLSLVAIVAYARAVRHGHRAYTHVVFAWGYVLVVTVIGVLAVSDEGEGLRWALAGANTVGGLAMLNVTGRYRGGRA
jgi:hypothetical protein